jgi:sec-independent protein translocase protein TatB
MQMFGIGILELMVILLLTVIVVGPDRLPAVAADLARWIRQGRAYARYMMRDFNSVVSELQKEAGTSAEDWKEIGGVLGRHTGDLGKELAKVGRDLDDSGDLDKAKTADSINGAASDGALNGDAGHSEATANGANGEMPSETAEEKPWYVPEKPRRATRRRSSE